MLSIPVVTERCAGIDVGKRGLAVAVAVGPADKEAEIQTRWYGTTVPALEELALWLRQQGCTAVGMESTGSYWIPVKNILEPAFPITLACARKHRPKKGDKTDFRDAVDLVVHLRHGMLTGSYLPERGIVELRDLTRRRKKLIGNLQSEKNRIQKVLETANVKIGNVVSDVFGVSGQEILQALLEDKPITAEEMAEMAKMRLRKKIPQLTETLQSHQMKEHHRWLIQQSIAHAQFLDEQIEELEKKIEEHLEPYRRQYELLMTIPGIKEAGAANILAEIGADIGKFPTSGQICKWAGICPGNNRSMGKQKSSHIKKANKFLLAALVEAAWGASRKKDSAFQRSFQRWLRKKGKDETCVAIAHKQLRVIWSVLTHNRPYVEPDAAVWAAIDRNKQVRHHMSQLRRLGADEQTIQQLMEQLLEPAASSQNGEAAARPIAESAEELPPEQTPPARPARPQLDDSTIIPAAHDTPAETLAPTKRPPRGVLGFRIKPGGSRNVKIFKEQMGSPPNGIKPKRSDARSRHVRACSHVSES